MLSRCLYESSCSVGTVDPVSFRFYSTDNGDARKRWSLQVARAQVALVAFHRFNAVHALLVLLCRMNLVRHVKRGGYFVIVVARHELSARMFNLVRNRPTHSTQPLSCECDKQCEEEAQPSTHGQQQNSSTIVKEQRRRRKELAS